MPVTIAVVGAGFMGRVHAQSYHKGGLDSSVGWVVDADRERAAALARLLPGSPRATDSLAEALADRNVQAVDVCVPTPLHRACVLEAAAAGRHVICEKPMAPSLEDADAMIRACRERGVIFMVAHVLRFWPEYIAAVDLAKSGRIGKLLHIACWRLSTPPAWSHQNWLRDARLSGGAVRDMAIHDFDVIRWLAGDPASVAAAGEVNHFAAVLRLSGGVSAQVESSFRMPEGFVFRMGLRVLGDRGLVEFDGAGGSLLVVEEGQKKTVPVAGSREFKQDGASEALDGYFYEIQHFVDCVARGVPAQRGTPEDGRAALAIAFEVEKSLARDAM